MAGQDGLSADSGHRLDSTLRHLVWLQECGISAGVAQPHLSGLRFHFLLRGWDDVKGPFFS